jgi:hypothetical protein
MAALALCMAGLCSPGWAQAPRQFPTNALRGTLVVTEPPIVLINKQEARLSPGARIWGDNNLMQLSGSLVNQKLLVNYTFDGLGQVSQVWILRADEAANQPWPRTLEQASTWSFDFQAQSWTNTGSSAPVTYGRH